MELPDTPAGRQASWFFAQASRSGRDLTVEEVVAHIQLLEPWTPKDGLERFKEDGPIWVTSFKETSPHELVVHLVYESDPDKRWVATFLVEQEPPHKIIRLPMARDVGEGIAIREASEEDAPLLADLERRSPLRVGDASITYDRGEDFFAFTRLMGETLTLVAEAEEGEILGMTCGTVHPVLVGGERYRALLVHHSRIPPEHRKKGLFSPLNINTFKAFEGQMDTACAYTAVDNRAAGKLSGPDRWSFPALRALVPCESVAGEPAGHPAGPDDAERIVEILNGCHEGEAMYLPHTAESLKVRLERAPELYRWEEIWMTERALLGVWPAGLKVEREESGRRKESVRATVLDHGFLPGAEGEFEGLLRAWCGRLFERGMSELAMMTSEGSPNYGVLSRLASRMDAFDFRMGAPEPKDAAERGLYVDGIYF